ncbi:MAG TPA: nucleotidyltransferase domain-containing protein [Gemmataceae bacterium]|nr:nucleotidyltransferase domain-containing protein [Gemmataceae bacterium]
MRTDKALDVLIPKTRQAVLSTLLLHGQRSWYLHELAAHLRVRPSSLQRELSRLTAAGILTRRRDGNRVFYQVDENCPLLVDLRGLLAKTVGLVDVLRGALEPLRASIEYAFVYGSLARGEETSASDIDLLIVGPAGLAEVAPALRQVEQQLGRPVNPSVYSLGEFLKKMRASNHFLTTVWGEKKLAVQGDLDELATIIGRQSGA